MTLPSLRDRPWAAARQARTAPHRQNGDQVTPPIHQKNLHSKRCFRACAPQKLSRRMHDLAVEVASGFTHTLGMKVRATPFGARFYYVAPVDRRGAAVLSIRCAVSTYRVVLNEYLTIHGFHGIHGEIP